MDFLNIFFKKETVTGLCALDLQKPLPRKKQVKTLAAYENFFLPNPEKIFKPDFDKNVLLI